MRFQSAKQPRTRVRLASYSTSYAYTPLDQLWQGPLAGGGEYQYLYCSSSQPQQLTGLYTSGATCSTKTGPVYTANTYDGFGNMTSRTFSNTTGTLTYDILDHLTQWSANANNQEQYLYDASGQRMLRRFTNNNGTTILTYPFGIEEHQYSGSGSNQWNVYYYFLAGQLLGSLDGNGTQFYLVDALGSIVSDFNNAAGAAALKGNQLFGPYGLNRYFAGNINTAKGFIWQYNDGTGLDYLNARYYDPVVGVFLSADMVQGNLQGMNPYAYVNGNPETHSDPSGRMFITEVGGGGGGLTVSPPSPQQSSCNFFCGLWNGAKGFVTGTVHVVANVADFVTGASSMLNDVRTIFSSKASFWDKVGAGADLVTNAASDVLMVTGIGEAARGIDLLVKGGVDLGKHLLEGEGAATLEHVAAGLGCGLSFAPATLVATAKGEQAIGTLHVGQKVWAYNPKTHKMEQEPILHVWINHDTDLVDLTLTTTTAAQHGKAATKTSETIHTNKKHPFLTKEKGFLTVGQITLGMHVLRADGTYGVVTGWRVVPGAEMMYDLEVAQDHTFTVGIQQWVVHNCASSLPKALQDLVNSGYQLESHFIERWVGDATHAARGVGLAAQDVVDVLQGGYHYLKTGDSYFSATKGGLTILYTQGRNTLFDLIERGVPSKGVTPLLQLIPNWTNPFYWMDLKP